MEFVQPIRDLKKIETIKKLLRQQNLRDYCLFVVGINSGLRISDLLKLRVSDVYENGKPKDRIRLREKKTNKFKDFPLSANAKSALKEYLKTRYHTADQKSSKSVLPHLQNWIRKLQYHLLLPML